MSQPRPLFGVQVVIVLRRGRLEHRRAEVRRVLERLGEGVVGQEAEAVGIAAPHVHVAGVIPALRGVFEQIDGADRKCRADHGHIGGKDGVGDEADLGMRTARLNQARARAAHC